MNTKMEFFFGKLMSVYSKDETRLEGLLEKGEGSRILITELGDNNG